MKKLEISQMENLQGEAGGFWAGFACVGAVVLGGAAIYGSGGLAAAVACNFAAAACGSIVGHASSTGYWF
jgi:hypothetical protein